MSRNPKSDDDEPIDEGKVGQQAQAMLDEFRKQHPEVSSPVKFIPFEALMSGFIKQKQQHDEAQAKCEANNMLAFKTQIALQTLALAYGIKASGNEYGTASSELAEKLDNKGVIELAITAIKKALTAK